MYYKGMIPYKERLMRKAKPEGRTTIGNWVYKYIGDVTGVLSSHDIRRVWGEIGRHLKSKGYLSEDYISSFNTKCQLWKETDLHDEAEFILRKVRMFAEGVKRGHVRAIDSLDYLIRNAESNENSLKTYAISATHHKGATK
jgi:hypothetical protein